MILESLDEIKASAGRHTMAITTDNEPADDAVKRLLGASTQSHGTLRGEPGVIIGGVKVVTPSASPDPVTLFVTLWQRQSPDARTATARKLVAALGTDAALNLCAEIDDAVVVAQAADIEADDKVMEESNYRAVWGDGDFVIRQRVWSERYGVGTITDIERERPAFYGELTIYYVEFDRGFEAPMLKRELLHYPVATVPADEADALLAQAGAVV